VNRLEVFCCGDSFMNALFPPLEHFVAKDDAPNDHETVAEDL
jgi:hypothetical protein